MTAMTTKVSTPSRSVLPGLKKGLLAAPWPTSPWTTEERLERIRVMGQQINGSIEFMCQVDTLNGTSTEAKEKAVAAFYEWMVTAQRQLGRIQEALQLE
jgi:hypothetical protein